MGGTKKKVDSYSLGKREDFLRKYGLSEEQFQRASIDWTVLEEIAKRQNSNLVSLEAAGALIADHLRQLDSVHSLKVRAKSPEHLAEKIIRKRLERPEIEISVENYPTLITDLVGVRVLQPFKGDLKTIHDFVKIKWNLHETPLAYIREGDPKDVREQFAEAGCDVQEHPHGYRSVHYLIISQPTK